MGVLCCRITSQQYRALAANLQKTLSSLRLLYVQVNNRFRDDMLSYLPFNAHGKLSAVATRLAGGHRQGMHADIARIDNRCLLLHCMQIQKAAALL